MTTPNRARPFGRADALLDRVLGGHWVLQVVVLYAFARIITTVMMAIVAPSQAPAAMTDGEAVGYIGFTRLWDGCLLYTSPSPRDRTRSRMPSSA